MHSSDDEETLHINVDNPLLSSKKKRRVFLSSSSSSDTDTDPEHKKISHSSANIELAQNTAFLRPSPERLEQTFSMHHPIALAMLEQV